MYSNPKLANLDCDTCRKYHLHPEDHPNAYEPIELFGGELLLRQDLPPCDTEVGCPKGHYSDPITLEGFPAAVLYTYRLCEGIRRWPSDEWFATYAAIISGIDKKHGRPPETR